MMMMMQICHPGGARYTSLRAATEHIARTQILNSALAKHHMYILICGIYKCIINKTLVCAVDCN